MPPECPSCYNPLPLHVNTELGSFPPRPLLKLKILYKTLNTHIQAYPDPPDGVCEILPHL